MRSTTFITILILLFSCDSTRVFEENRDFENLYWYKEQVPEFAFDIDDTTASYNILINIRNSFDYPFYNLYYQFELKDSTGSVINKDMLEIILFDAKTGEPQGSGLGDLFDHQKPVMKDVRFPYAGEYSIAFTHFMRPDTLPLILSVGTRVEKSEN